MSTSDIEQRPELAPRPYMSITEVILGGIFVLALTSIGPIGSHTHAWSDKTAALMVAGGVFCGFAIWGIIHSFLVKTELIRPIDLSLRYAQSQKPHGYR